MPNFAQNVANKRYASQHRSPEQVEIDWQRLLVGVSYTHLMKPLGNAREDLFWSMQYMTLEQKVVMAQAWEEYFCRTEFST